MATEKPKQVRKPVWKLPREYREVVEAIQAEFLRVGKRPNRRSVYEMAVFMDWRRASDIPDVIRLMIRRKHLGMPRKAGNNWQEAEAGAAQMSYVDACAIWNEDHPSDPIDPQQARRIAMSALEKLRWKLAVEGADVLADMGRDIEESEAA